MTNTKQRRAYAALRHTIDALEGESWRESIRERGFRLTTNLEGASLSISPCSNDPRPSAPPVRCRHREENRLEHVRNHMVCLRGDLLSIGLDFADRFPEATRKIMNGEPLAVIEYDPRPNTADAPLPQS